MAPRRIEAGAAARPWQPACGHLHADMEEIGSPRRSLITARPEVIVQALLSRIWKDS
jgi:hypothetical protein